MLRKQWAILLFNVLLLALASCRGDRPSVPTPTSESTSVTDAPTDEPTSIVELPTDTPLAELVVTASQAPTDTANPQDSTGLLSGLLGGDGMEGVVIPPRVIGTSPATAELLVLDDAIEIYFDQPMDEAETGRAIMVVDEDGSEVAGEVSWPQPRILRFKPEKIFKANAQYTATLADTAVSALGDSLLDGLTLGFETVGDISVTAITPTDGGDEIALDSAVTVIFDQPVVPLGVVEQREWPDPIVILPETAGKGEWVSTSVFVWRPDEGLIGRQAYEVRVSASAVNEASVTGAQLAEDVVSTFTTTAPTIEKFGLVSEPWGVNDNYRDLKLDEGYVVTFSDAMERGVTEENIVLRSEDASDILPLSFEWNEASTLVEVTAERNLIHDTEYVFVVLDQAQAANGAKIRNELVWYATTVKYPSIVQTEPRDGATKLSPYTDYFEIRFASPMDEASLADKVIFDPPLRNEKGYYNEYSQSLNFWGLDPSTKYTVTILPGMADAYGVEIATGETISFWTSDAPSALRFRTPQTGYWGNDGSSLVRASETDGLWIAYRNLDGFVGSLYSLRESQLNRVLKNGLDLSVIQGELIRQYEGEATAESNTTGFDKLLLQDEDGNPLPPGIYLAKLRAVSPNTRISASNQVVVIANANVTLKTTTTEAMIWVTDLETGEPLADVPVELVSTSDGIIFSGTTSADGVIYQDGLNLSAATYETAYYAKTDSPDIFGVAVNAWDDGIQPYDFDISTDYFRDPFELSAYIYTDRPLYRPDQTVQIKGVLRTDDDLAYTIPDIDTIDVLINSYEGQVLREEVSVSDFGTFELSLDLDSEAILGDYRIELRHSNFDRFIGGGNFGVAEYQKPTFQVAVTSDKPAVLNGETIPVTVQADFFSGGVVVDGDVEWTVRSRAYNFTPTKAWRDYSYTNHEWSGYSYYGGGFAAPGTFISEGSGKTDGSGAFTVQIPADLLAESNSQTFTIEATVSDVGGNPTSGRTAVTVHKSELYPGIRTTSYLGKTNEPTTFHLTALDWDSNPVPDQPIDLIIKSQEWMSVQEEDEQGRTIWRSEVKETAVFTSTATSSDEFVTLDWTPSAGGSYRAYATSTDSQGNRSTANTYIWVTSGDYVPWRRTNDHNFDLIPSATEFSPGDTAELLIASPYQGTATALVTVERGHITSYDVIELTSNSTVYELPITADMAPNIFVSVLVLKGVDETNPFPDYKIGMTRFDVARTEQELNVAVTADQTQVGPADEVTYTVQVTDHAGNPVEAELSLALADLSALSLAERRDPNILDFFYSPRWLSVRTSLLLNRLLDSFNQELEDEIKGGGGGGGDFGVATVRENFQDTAFWQGQVTTDDTGTAQVTVALPDNLTTWRMDVRAITADTKVGEGTLDILATRPLIIQPITPRFFVQKDVSQMSAVVSNNTDEEITATVSLEATGVTVQNAPTQEITVLARQQAAVTWEITVLETDGIDATFTVSGGGYTDASKPTLGSLAQDGIPVYKFEAINFTGTSGQLLDSGVLVESLAIPVYDDWSATQGDVTVSVAPSLSAAMTDGLDYLEHFEFECTEQVVSKFLPNVVTTRALAAAGISDPALESDLADQVQIGLNKLYTRQRSNGGWPYWDNPRSKTNSLVTSWVVLALIEAQEAGYDIDQSVLDNGIAYLDSNGRSSDNLSGRYKLNRNAFKEYVLARAGQPDFNRLESLFETREMLDLYARAYLAQAFYYADAGDPRLTTLTDDLVSQVQLSATGASWIETERDYYNWNSDTRSTAIILDTLLKTVGESDLTANTVRWLMANRSNGGYWRGTQETAWSLMSLTNWLTITDEANANYAYEVAVNGDLALSGQASPATLRETASVTLDVQDLFYDQLNRFAIARDEGAGNLYYTAHMEIDLPVPEITALDQGITISRSYFNPDDRENPVTSAQVGEMLLGRLTIVAPKTLYNVVIEDYLPAGLEAVDTSLLTSPSESAPDLYDGDVWRSGYGWWYFDFTQLKDEKVVISSERLPKGTYEYVYLVRATTEGEYRVIPPTAHEFYFPEVFGRGTGSLFEVLP